MLVPSRNVIPSWTPRCWARSSRRSQTPRRAQRRKVWAARDHGPSSAGMARHLAPFSCRQTIADSVRRRSFGCVLPWGRHASTNGSKLIQCASDSIALSSFQEGQNARHHNRFKREQALQRERLEREQSRVKEAALAIWKSSVPPEGTPVARYLEARGLGGPIPSSLRYLKRCRHTPSDTHHPAMIAGVAQANGILVAVHRTFLREDGSG